MRWKSVLDRLPRWSRMTSRQRWVLAGSGTFVLLLLAIFWFAGRPLVALVSDADRFREWVADKGFWGQLAFMGMMTLQIVVAFIPGEPLEIAAGYAFGAWQGTVLCLLGAAGGSIGVFLLVRTLGVRAVEAFFPREKIDEVSFLREGRRRDLLLFLAFFIPGTPKDILTYVSGLTRISLGRWLLLTTPARIPSIITSTIGGDALGVGNFAFAALVFAATVVISGAGLLVYRRVCLLRGAPDHPVERGEEGQCRTDC